MDEFHINDRVTVVGKNSVGTIAFIGNTRFSNGLWLGIVLDQPVGRNNGSYEGIRYFKCSKNHGIFTRPCQVKKTPFIPPESEDQKVNYRKNYPNYLRDDSLPKPTEKHDRYIKSTTLKKVRKDITLIPFSSSEDVNLEGNSPEVKSKSMTQSEKYLPKTQFCQQENEAKDSSPNKTSRMSVCELRDMTSKISDEVNEVKDYISSLNRKTQTLKNFREKQFFQQEKESKGSSPEKGVKMQACEARNMMSKTSDELHEVKDNVRTFDRETQVLNDFHEKQLPQQEEKKGKESSPDEEGTRRGCKLIEMISKTSKDLNEVKDYVLTLDKKLKLLNISLREERSACVEN